jgi:hypothetical protein
MKSAGLAVTSMLVLFLLVFLPECAGQRSATAQELRLAQIAAMFHGGHSQQEIARAWESFFRTNPKTNVDWALSFLRKEVERTGDEHVQQARQRLALAKRSQDSARDELANARRKPAGATQPSARDLERRLQAAGDEAQWADAALQECYQDTQKAVQTLSTMTKQFHDQAMAIINNTGR